MQQHTEVAAYRQVKEDIVADILSGIYPAKTQELAPPQFPQASLDLETGSLYRLLIHKANLIPHHSDETIRAIGCPPEITRHFGMQAAAPILFAARVTSAEDGRINEYCEDYQATDVNGLQRRCYHDHEDDYKRRRWYAHRG